MLIILIISIILIIITILFLFLKEILSFIDNRCKYLREFISKNGGIFTILFSFLFFVEQILLIVAVSYFLEIPPKAQFIISLFTLIVLTTATFEKFILEKRNEYQKVELIKTAVQNEEMLTQFKQLSEDYQKLYEKYQKSSKK
jgi:hypothetical protein